MQQTTEIKQSIFIVTGMHRSGTSLAASILQSAGVDIGQRLMGSAVGNVKGHFEDLDFVEFHASVLHSQGISIDGWTLEKKLQVQEQYLDRAKSIVQKKFSKPIWGWKDPRTTLFLSFWADLLPTAKFLFIYRSPWEVVDSLYRRGIQNDEVFYYNPSFAIQIWINYNQTILDFYKQFPDRCLLFNTHSITHDPNVIAKAIEENYEVVLSCPDLSIYDESLFHGFASSSHRPALIKNYFSEAFTLYNELNNNAFSLDISSLPWSEPKQVPPYKIWAFQDWLDIRRLERQQSTFNTELDKAQFQLQHTQTELEQSQSQLQQTQTELEQSQSQLQQTQTELEQSQSQLQHTKTELEQWQSQLQLTQAELEQSRSQSHAELEQWQSQLQLTQAELEQWQSQLQLTQAELEQSRSQSHAELEQWQSQLQHTQAELELSQSRSHTELDQSRSQFYAELEQSQSQLQHTQTELEQSQSQLEQAHKGWESCQNLITAMKSSKFWKLQQTWSRLKQASGYKQA